MNKTHVGSDKVDLGMAVLSGLRGRHVDDLARTPLGKIISKCGQYMGVVYLDHDVPALAKGRALHGERERGARARLLKGLVVLLVVGHYRGGELAIATGKQTALTDW
jgi:acetoacetate decarboxylase